MARDGDALNTEPLWEKRGVAHHKSFRPQTDQAGQRHLGHLFTVFPPGAQKHSTGTAQDIATA